MNIPGCSQLLRYKQLASYYFLLMILELSSSYIFYHTVKHANSMAVDNLHLLLGQNIRFLILKVFFFYIKSKLWCNYLGLLYLKQQWYMSMVAVDPYILSCASEAAIS